MPKQPIKPSVVLTQNDDDAYIHKFRHNEKTIFQAVHPDIQLEVIANFFTAPEDPASALEEEWEVRTNQ